MGIHSYSNLVYGIKLSDKQAEKLDVFLREEAELPIADFSPEDHSFEDVLDELYLKKIILAGENTHGSLHSGNGFERGSYGDDIDTYYFGVDLGTSNITNTIKKGMTEDIQEKWDEVEVLLRVIGIKDEPDFHLYNNQW